MKKDLCYENEKNNVQKTLNCKKKTLNPTNAQNFENKKKPCCCKIFNTNKCKVGHNVFSPTQILEVGGS
jgi:hypothetical protein